MIVTLKSGSDMTHEVALADHHMREVGGRCAHAAQLVWLFRRLSEY